MTKLVSEKEVTLMEDGSVSWGRNSKGVAERARKYLGWQPKGAPLKDTIREVVAKEAKDLGLKAEREEELKQPLLPWRVKRRACQCKNNASVVHVHPEQTLSHRVLGESRP